MLSKYMRYRLSALIGCFALLLSGVVAAQTDRLMPGNNLTNNASIRSPSGNYVATMEGGGSFIIYRTGNSTVRYNFGNAGVGAAATMQTDGNFVIYRPDASAFWNSETWGGRCNGCWLQINDSGNLLVTNGSIIGWQLGSDPSPLNPYVYPNRILPGGVMQNGRTITSPSGRYSLIMQTDGSLVMYRNDGSIRYSMAKHGDYATMQYDGNFVEHGSNGTLWSTGTNCSGCWLEIMDNGDLQIRFEGYSGGSYVSYSVWGIGYDTEAPPRFYSNQRYPLIENAPSNTPPAPSPADTAGTTST